VFSGLLFTATEQRTRQAVRHLYFHHTDNVTIFFHVNNNITACHHQVRAPEGAAYFTSFATNRNAIRALQVKGKSTPPTEVSGQTGSTSMPETA